MDLIWVKIPGDRGSFHERDEAHPDGEVFVRGGGPAVQVARTSHVVQALAQHLVQVDAPEPPDDAEDEDDEDDQPIDPPIKPIVTDRQEPVANEQQEAVTPPKPAPARKRGRPAAPKNAGA